MRDFHSSKVVFILRSNAAAIVLEWFSAFQNIFCVIYECLYVALAIGTSLGVQVVTINFHLELVVRGFAILDLEKLPGERRCEFWNPVLVRVQFFLISDEQLVEILNIRVMAEKAQNFQWASSLSCLITFFGLELLCQKFQQIVQRISLLLWELKPLLIQPKKFGLLK